MPRRPGALSARTLLAGALPALAMLAMAAPALAQDAMDRLAADLAGSLAAQARGQQVLVLPFTNADDGTACGPLSDRLRGAVHRAVIATGKLTAILGLDGVNDNPLVVRGRFTVNAATGIQVMVEAGRDTVKMFDGSASLPPPTARAPEQVCVYTLEHHGRTYTVQRDLVARDAPFEGAPPVTTFRAGASILVEKNLRGTPWKIVLFDDPESLFRQERRRVFVAARRGQDIAGQ